MKRGKGLIVGGLLLILAAFLLTGYNLWRGYEAGVSADAVLEEILPEMEEEDPEQAGGGDVPADEIEYPDYVLNPQMDMPVKIVDGNAYVGVIKIPSRGKEFPVFNEWNYSNLKTAPCRYSGTAYLGNLVICAHNYRSHFGGIRTLGYGDEVIFTDMDGNAFHYKVMEIETLDPYAIEDMTAGDWDLTLFTCTLGGATRVTVRCESADTGFGA